jgi:seryl-tRNA synthetase
MTTKLSASVDALKPAPHTYSHSNVSSTESSAKQKHETTSSLISLSASKIDSDSTHSLSSRSNTQKKKKAKRSKTVNGISNHSKDALKEFGKLETEWTQIEAAEREKFVRRMQEMKAEFADRLGDNCLCVGFVCG